MHDTQIHTPPQLTVCAQRNCSKSAPPMASGHLSITSLHLTSINTRWPLSRSTAGGYSTASMAPAMSENASSALGTRRGNACTMGWGCGGVLVCGVGWGGEMEAGHASPCWLRQPHGSTTDRSTGCSTRVFAKIHTLLMLETPVNKCTHQRMHTRAPVAVCHVHTATQTCRYGFQGLFFPCASSLSSLLASLSCQRRPLFGRADSSCGSSITSVMARRRGMCMMGSPAAIGWGPGAAMRKGVGWQGGLYRRVV